MRKSLPSLLSYSSHIASQTIHDERFEVEKERSRLTCLRIVDEHMVEKERVTDS